MKPISRRSALTLGGIGAALIVAGSAGLFWEESTTTTQASPGAGSPLRQPAILRSRNGLLSASLTVQQKLVLIGTTRVLAMTYGGALPGPTLVVQPGDTLSIAVHNGVNVPTNLHTHGLHVSPIGQSDNPLRRIDPGTTAQYLFEIPADHPAGVFWYHPHHHGMAADQVFAGLYGTIIVEEPKPIEVTRERVLVVSDMTFDQGGVIAAASHMDRMLGREGQTILVNGQVAPTLHAHPGDRERWRIVNACTSRYLDLRLDGQQLQLLGNDSGRFPAPRMVQRLTLLPGNRADVIVTMASGKSVLDVVAVDRGSMIGMGSSVISAGTVTGIAALTVSGAASSPGALSVPQFAPQDLRTRPTDRSRTLILAMAGGGMRSGTSVGEFTIDGKSFAPARVDQHVSLGSVEEWTIVNTSPMDHPFHLHVWPMQVVRIGGDIQLSAIWQDVVNVPAHGSTVVRIAFEDFAGTSVYHCHILDHEDNGMMGIIAVA